MGQLVPASGGGALAAYGGVNPWTEAARGVETGAYLKFNGNDGIYSFGQDDDELPVGSRVITDMQSLALGWICWVDSAVEEEILVPVVEGKAPQEHTLTDHGPYNDDDGWRGAASLSCVIESYGDDDRDEAVGTRLLWKTSTSGQVRSIQKLSGAYGRLFAQHPDEFPIVELGADHYAPKNKKHGKIKWSPNLKIVGWISADELDGLVGDADNGDDYEEPVAAAPARGRAAPEPEVAQRGRRAAAPVDEEPADPAPRGRRAAAPPVDDDQGEPDETPAPRGRRAAAPPVEDVVDDEPAPPAPRGRRAAPPVEDDQGEPDPAPRGARRGAPAEDEGAEAPAPRGRSAGRGAPPENARLRNFG